MLQRTPSGRTSTVIKHLLQSVVQRAEIHRLSDWLPSYTSDHVELNRRRAFQLTARAHRIRAPTLSRPLSTELHAVCAADDSVRPDDTVRILVPRSSRACASRVPVVHRRRLTRRRSAIHLRRSPDALPTPQCFRPGQCPPLRSGRTGSGHRAHRRPRRQSCLPSRPRL